MDTKPVIIQETEIPMYELRKEIGEIKKRDKELNFRAQKTDEYLNAFVLLKDSELKALIEDIRKMNIPRLRDAHIYKIADLLPTNTEDVKVILQGYTLTVSQENMKKIADAVKKYLPEKKETKAQEED
jgi:DNA-directed RNA polymerase subunit F